MKMLQIHPKIQASEIVLGCMRMDSLSRQEAQTLIETALDLGVNMFDHADIYGQAYGACETLFGQVLAGQKGLRDRMLLQSKCGIRGSYYDFSKQHILETVDGSLSRLQTDHLDILLLHRPDTLVEPEEVADAFDTLEKAGKVRAFGVSNQSPMQIELLKTAVRQPLTLNQLQFSPLRAGMVNFGLNVNTEYEGSVDHDGGILEYCRIHGITIQPWSPFQQGQIHGTYLGVRGYAQLNSAIDELAEQYGVSPNALVIAWILRHPAHMQPIVGTTKPEHLKEIVQAAQVDMSRPDWYKLYTAAGNRVI